MVSNRRGQSIMEYIVMLGILTLIGGWIMKSMTGGSSDSKNGGIQIMQDKSTKKIAEDER